MSTPLARTDSPQADASRAWRRVGRVRLWFTVGAIGLLAGGPLLGGSLSFYYTLALALICQLFIAHLPDRITGGSFGIMLGRGSQPLASFYAMLVLMTGSLLFITWLAVSRLGKALRAIRDDPEAAGVLGINVARARLKAWMASATVAGFAGGVDVWYTNIVDPESGFEFLITAKTIIYAIAGGLGTVLGPVVGALVMVSIDDVIWQRFPLLNMMILGLAIILLMLFLPRGIVGTAVQRWPVLRRYLM